MNARYTMTLLCLVASLCSSTRVRADSDADAQASPRQTFDAASSARHGLTLPVLVAPSSEEAGRVVATAWSGYDGARGSTVLRSYVDAHIWGRLSVRAGVSYLPDGVDASAQPNVGAKLALVRNRRGFDLALGAFYRLERFTSEEGLAQLLLTGAYGFGKTRLFANLIYGQDLEGDDFEGEAVLSALYSIKPWLQVGASSHVRLNLASEDPKRTTRGTSDLEASLAPTVMYSVGPVAIMAQVGVTTMRAGTFQTGALAMGGLSGSY